MPQLGGDVAIELSKRFSADCALKDQITDSHNEPVHEEDREMNETIQIASARTREILDEVGFAVRLLDGNDRPRTNAVGVLIDPETYEIALQSARAAIDRALAIHAGTKWPSKADYDAM